MIPVSNLFDVEYIYNKDDPYREYGDYEKLLDYTLFSDEDCINLQMLFSEHPTKENNNIVQVLKSEGIFPSENRYVDNIDIHELQLELTDDIGGE